MGLVDLWNESPGQLKGKQVQQVIAFAGTGKLTDGSEASADFRKFLSLVPSDLLRSYADECLTAKFDNSGLALQDIINQVGRRLGFTVEDGRYRGVQGQPGFDGIWRAKEGTAIVVEVKTTDAYRIDLETIAEYRNRLIREGQLAKEESSILIVVGRHDTGDLEAQIRGSRHAWDMRLIGVDGLLRLMKLKEEVDDPLTFRKVCGILSPQEFTKVDSIIDIVFLTADDIAAGESTGPADAGDGKPKGDVAVSVVREAAIARVQKSLGKPLVKQSRVAYESPDGSATVLCLVSREYNDSGIPGYWYAFHDHQRDALAATKTGYVAFVCGSAKTVLLVPYTEVTRWLPGLNRTEREGGSYSHVVIFLEENHLVLRQKKGFPKRDLSSYLLGP